MIDITLWGRGGLIRDYALIDDSDEDLVSAYRWRLCGGYAATGQWQSLIYMHRLIAQPGDGLEVDHINRDRLDNRRSNLRVLTHAQNTQNHPGRGEHPRGVHFSTRNQKWVAQASVGGKKIWGGYYATEAEAAAAAEALRSEHMSFAVRS